MVARPSDKAAKAVQEAARLFNHAISLMNATSGPVSMVVGPPYGSWVGGRIVVVWYQRQAAISPASAAAKFSVVPSMVALPVLDILETWTTPFYGLAGSR